MVSYNSFFKIKKQKIVDCFTFYNETDLLKYRLRVLDDTVDYFILVEARQTHAGNPKPLFYKENNRMLFGDAKKMLDEVLVALKV